MLAKGSKISKNRLRQHFWLFPLLKLCRTHVTFWINELVYVCELYRSYTSEAPKIFTRHLCTVFPEHLFGGIRDLASLICSPGAFRLGMPSFACRMVNEQVYTMDQWRMVADGTGGGIVLEPGVPVWCAE